MNMKKKVSTMINLLYLTINLFACLLVLSLFINFDRIFQYLLPEIKNIKKIFKKLNCLQYLNEFSRAFIEILFAISLRLCAIILESILIK